MVTAAVIALAALVSGCSASIGGEKTGGTYNKHGVSFKIPDGWSRKKETTGQVEAGTRLWSEAFAPASGYDLVSVTAYKTTIKITRNNAGRYTSDIRAFFSKLASSAGGTISAPSVTTVGQLAGYRFEVSAPAKDGSRLRSWKVLAWNGYTEYFFNCQYKVGSSRKAEVKRACNTVVDSFKVT